MSTIKERIVALSPGARDWLERTCERQEFGEPYDHEPEAVMECVKAGLVIDLDLPPYFIEVRPDVVDVVLCKP